MSLILVTGATGRMGSHVSEALLSRNEEVRAIVRSGSRGAVPSGAEKFEADISTSPLPNAAFDVVSKVIHRAGLVGDFPASELVRQNALATRNLLSSCPLSLQKFIHASSISVYGEHGGQIVDETFHPSPDSHYGKSKLLAEEFCSEYCSRFPIILLRFGMVYGPGFEDRYEKVLEYIEKGKMKVLGDGTNRLPFVHINDVVSAVLAALDASIPSGSAYNIVGPDAYTQEEIYRMAAQELGVAPPKEHASPYLAKFAAMSLSAAASLSFGKPPSVTVEHIRRLTLDRAYSCEKAKKELGWEPKVKLKEGIAEMVRLYKSRKQVE